MVCYCHIDCVKSQREIDFELLTFQLKDVKEEGKEWLCLMSFCNHTRKGYWYANISTEQAKEGKETFEVRETNGNSFKIIFNIIFVFQTKNNRNPFSGPWQFNCFAKCLPTKQLVQLQFATATMNNDIGWQHFMTLNKNCYRLYFLIIHDWDKKLCVKCTQEIL